MSKLMAEVLKMAEKCKRIKTRNSFPRYAPGAITQVDSTIL